MHNYRRNLILYWRQFYPNWKVPAGYHVHHIKPKCTFSDKNDPRIHHPRNLIALHPDDHASIHKCRGDTHLSDKFITSVIGRVMSEENKQARRDYKHSKAARLKISKASKGKVLSAEHKQKISDIRKGMKLGTPSMEHKQKISQALSGKAKTAEHKQKLSAAGKGRSVWNAGLTGRRWHTNGIITIICFSESAPLGFILGRKLKGVN